MSKSILLENENNLNKPENTAKTVEENQTLEDTKTVEEVNTIENLETHKNEKNTQIIKSEQTSLLLKYPENEYNNSKNSSKTSVFQIFLIIACIILAIFLISFVTFTIINVKSDKIISGVFVQGYEVSGYTQENALKNVNNMIISKLPAEIKLKHNDYETSIQTQDLNIKFDTNMAIKKAFRLGRTGNLLENNWEILQSKFSRIDINPVLTLDEETLKNQLADISGKLPDAVIESSYYLEDSNLILTKGRKGCVVDVEKTASSIIEQIKNLNIKNNTIEIITQEKSPSGLDIDKIHSELYVEAKDAYYTQNPFAVYPSENGIDFAISIDKIKEMLQEEKEEYSVPLKILYPSVTTNMLGTEAFPDQLSTYSTNYSTAAKARTTNLRLAANKINGTVIMPGETFSYNKVVGERTISAGYKEAPIYVSGQVVDGVGGGICQITTTLYNAVVLANLEIVERTNHQFVPSYARASRDATVVYGSIDFKFKNNRNYPIKLVCSVANGKASFQIFGAKQENDYEVQITDRVTGTTSNAIYSEAYKILKQNGQVVQSTLLSRDVYKRH